MHSLVRPPVFVVVCFFALWLSGCTTRVYGYTDTVAYASGPPPAATYVDTDPDLVVLDDGVWVVCDQPGTVYYTGGAYWHYGSGVWYRSTAWGGPRVRVGLGYVPFSIRSRAHWRWRRYNAPAHLRVRYTTRRGGRWGRNGRWNRNGRWGRADRRGPGPGVRVRNRGRGRAQAGPPARPRATPRRPDARRRDTRRPRRPDARRPGMRPQRTMPTPRHRTKPNRRPRATPPRDRGPRTRNRDVVRNRQKKNRGRVTRTTNRRTTVDHRNGRSRTRATHRRTTVSRGKTKVTRSRSKASRREKRRSSRRDRRR